jgi:O-phospho-L-seryl-tRNASec:L-selenocysteinyl-tRNA synthase
VEPVIVSDQLMTDLEGMEKEIKSMGAAKILCLYSTTSCFAPRARDDVTAIAKLCGKHDIFHLINNAYGLQDNACSKIIEKASRYKL